MHLTTNVIARIEHVAKRHIRFKNLFVGLIEEVRRLSNIESGISGLILDAPSDENYFDVFFVGIKIRFLLLSCCAEDDAVRGQIICTREVQNLSGEQEHLGNFTFNGQGVTDFEVKDGHEPIEIPYHAIEIVLHFVNLAVEKPIVSRCL